MLKLIGGVLLIAMTVACCCIIGSTEGCLPSAVGAFGYWLKEQCWTALIVLAAALFAVPVLLALLSSWLN